LLRPEIARRGALRRAEGAVEGGEAFEAAGKATSEIDRCGAYIRSLRLASRRSAVTVCEKLFSVVSNNSCMWRTETPNRSATKAGDRFGFDR
jgi:hypothetical protein